MELQYFHGNITKSDCEQLLLNKGKNGSFLIRESETIPGALCLCILFEEVIYTYRIFQKHNGHFMIQTSEGTPNQDFKTIKDLITTFQKPNQGLIIELCYPVNKTRYTQRSQTVYAAAGKACFDFEDNDYVDVLPD